VEDPTGKGRHRVVDSASKSPGLLNGSVHWVPVSDKREQGSVFVGSSNSPVGLRL
jgi:hypothetical protein